LEAFPQTAVYQNITHDIPQTAASNIKGK